MSELSVYSCSFPYDSLPMLLGVTVHGRGKREKLMCKVLECHCYESSNQASHHLGRCYGPMASFVMLTVVSEVLPLTLTSHFTEVYKWYQDVPFISRTLPLCNMLFVVTYALYCISASFGSYFQQQNQEDT